MKVRIVAFATARDAIGESSIDVEMPDDSTLAELADRLRSDFPSLEPIWSRLAVAIDGQIADASARLQDGSEVALLPPVSGGQSSVSRLTEELIDVNAAEAAVRQDVAGATVIFIGAVRDHHRGKAVEKINYDAYRPMAESKLETLCNELSSEKDRTRVEIVHRIGEIAVGEASVVIAVSSPHREQAYQVSRLALERLKREIPIWKQEYYSDGGSAWREEESLSTDTSSIPT